MSKKLIYLISFVLVLGLANNALADLMNDPSLVIYYSFNDVGNIVADQSGKGRGLDSWGRTLAGRRL